LVTAALLAGLCMPAAAAVAQQTTTSQVAGKQFEVVAVKQSSPDSQGKSWHGTNDRITIQNYSLREMIRVAYGLKSNTQVLGGPGWIDKQHFDFSAKIDDADVDRIKGMNIEERSRQIQLMLQTMLAERFLLKVTADNRIMSVYLLVPAKSGAKLTALAEPKDLDELKTRNHSTSSSNGHLAAKAISMDSFADYLTSRPDIGDRVVLNRTELIGEFDFKLDWAEDRGGGIPADATLPGIFAALQEQMGLELKSDKGSIPVIVVDTVNEPEQN
jgi:uncharacterized protein (TIGR03435 family)